MKFTHILFTILVISSIFTTPIQAQQTAETFEAQITDVKGTRIDDTYGQQRSITDFELKVTDGSYQGEYIIVNQDQTLSTTTQYSVGDNVVVVKTALPDGSDNFVITDFVRRDALLFLTILFVILVIIIAKGRGFYSLLGLVLSFVIIFNYILPLISLGYDPVMVAILASAVIIPSTFYLSHGFNKKTHIAIAGTLFSLIITGILATIFVKAANLSGFSSEEANFLSISKGGNFNFQGLILAGIIIGTLGVLDDITVSQSAIVLKLKETAGNITIAKLYQKAISIGHDHIASLVNTLILVYTGAALPLLIMFVDANQPIKQLINYEIIAEEIVRTLIASMGLVIAVPVTTLLACIVVNSSHKKKPLPKK